MNEKKVYALKLVSGEEVLLRAIKTDEGYVVESMEDLPIVFEIGLMGGLTSRPWLTLIVDDAYTIKKESVIVEKEITEEKVIKGYENTVDRILHPEKYESPEEKARRLGLTVPGDTPMAQQTNAKNGPNLKIVK